MNPSIYTRTLTAPIIFSYQCKLADSGLNKYVREIIRYEKLKHSRSKNLVTKEEKLYINQTSVKKNLDESKTCQLPYTRQWDARIKLFRYTLGKKN